MSRFKLSSSSSESQADPFDAGEPVMPADDDAARRLDEAGGPQGARATRPSRASPPALESSPPSAPRSRARARRAAGASQTPSHRRSSKISMLLVLLIMFSLSPLSRRISRCASSVMTSNLHGRARDAAVEHADLTRQEGDTEGKACGEVVESRLASVAGDTGSARALIAKKLSNTLARDTGYSADELGIDTTATATWALSQFSYELSYASILKDGTAQVSCTTTAPELGWSAFDTGISDYLAEQDRYGSTSEDRANEPLSEEQRDHIRTLFAEALSHVKMDYRYVLTVKLTKVDGVWTIDADAYDKELARAFGLFGA